MPAIVTVKISPEASGAFNEVVYNNAAISATELGVNSGMYDVVFSAASVQIGTGFDTLQRLLNEQKPGAGDGVSRVERG
jgi:hypothetical protein